MSRQKQYMIYPADEQKARIEATRLAMDEFGVKRAEDVTIVELKSFQDRRGATGYDVWVRVG